jgi:hypothetical protein
VGLALGVTVLLSMHLPVCGGVLCRKQLLQVQHAISGGGLGSAASAGILYHETSCCRGFHVVGVEADPTLLARTFRFAQVSMAAAILVPLCLAANGRMAPASPGLSGPLPAACWCYHAPACPSFACRPTEPTWS